MMAVIVALIMENVLIINNAVVNMVIVTFQMLIVDQNVKASLDCATALTINVVNSMVGIKMINAAVNGLLWYIKLTL